MSVLDKLIGADITNFNKAVKKIKMNRLSKALGEDIIFTIQSIDAEQLADIQENSMTVSEKGADFDIMELQIQTIMAGLIDPNVRDKALKTKFNARTPKEVIIKLLNPSEISEIYEQITLISGFDGDVIEEVKN